jgi:formamidopyrimidine-DNA glycosylase
MRAGTIATANGAPKKSALQLAASIKAVLTSAIMRRESPYRSARFKVYDRNGEPCPRKSCGGTIKSIWQAGRSTYYCPKCQR